MSTLDQIQAAREYQRQARVVRECIALGIIPPDDVRCCKGCTPSKTLHGVGTTVQDYNEPEDTSSPSPQ